MNRWERFAERMGVSAAQGRSWVTTQLAHWLVIETSGVFLVSWPRSGSTWLRTMLTHLLLDHFDSNPEVFNKIIPGTTLTRISHRPRNEMGLRSTHGLYCPRVKKTVYLVRDVRQAVGSFYRYTTTRRGRSVEPALWASMYAAGLYGPRWDQHVESWLGSRIAQDRDRFLLVRYEDMRAAPRESLEEVARFLGIRYAPHRTERAVKLSAPQVMRQWETRQRGTLADWNASFYRGGGASEWDQLFGPAERARILAPAAKAMDLVGYGSGQ